MIVSGNIPFLQEMAEIIGARFTPGQVGRSTLYVSDRWVARHGFQQEDHRTDLIESTWMPVRRVTPVLAEGNKPFIVYSFKCEPHPTFLIGVHLSHNCEHHLLPFWCDIIVAYIAEDKVLGLSKFARIARQFAHRLQLQERLTHQIADVSQRVTGSDDVFVVGRGEHLCMSMRGIKTPSIMSNSVVRGKFRDLLTLRAEALSLMGL